MFIFNILIILVLILIYIYSGLKLVEPIKNINITVFFWFAYIFFGITLINIIAISKYWGKLSTKTGPPGPRGPIGDNGSQGSTGKCNKNANIIYAQKLIKETITNTIIENYNDLSIDDIFNKTELKLTNNYLDYKVKLMVNSQQFNTLLLTPTDDNNPNRNEKNVYGKTIDDLSKYLSSIWREWIIGIINIDKYNARTLFITYDAQIDISPEIEKYFNTEIMKYDIWYWGATRVFRPLEAEVCRNNYNINGKNYNNTIYPIGNRPKLEIKELEFTNSSIQNDNNFIKILELDMGSISNNITNHSFNNKYDINTRYNKPIFYLPKVYTVPKTGQKFYPLGCVIVDGNNNEDKIKRKILLVSGDIIIPDNYFKIWDNELRINDKYNVSYRYKRKRGLRKTETKYKNEVITDIYKTYLEQSLIDLNNKYNLDNRLVYNQKLQNNSQTSLIEFYKFTSSIDEYIFLSDMPTFKGSQGINKLLNIMNYNNKKNYMGIVGIPKTCVKDIKDYNIEWSFNYNNLLDKKLKKSINKYVEKPYNASKFNKNYYVNYKSLERTVSQYNPIKIYKNKEHNFIKINTNNITDKPKSIKKECYNTSQPIKNIDKTYNDLGIGWFGSPLKQNRKYSIFTYLGLMPEGIIVHRTSGRKFYIKHYGGIEPNKYVILLWNEKLKDYKNAITYQNNNTCYIGILKLTDTRCQFKVILDKEDNSYFRLVPVEYPTKYLKINFKVNKDANLQKDKNNIFDDSLKKYRPNGINLDHTEMYLTLSNLPGDLKPNNPVLFFNQPTTGTNMQIINENIPRNIDRSQSTSTQIKQQKILNQTNENSFNYLHKNNNIINLTDETFPDSNLNYSL